jgi:hypothetical protein
VPYERGGTLLSVMYAVYLTLRSVRNAEPASLYGQEGVLHATWRTLCVSWFDRKSMGISDTFEERVENMRQRTEPGS